MKDIETNMRVYLHSIKMLLLSGIEYKGWWLNVLQVLVVCVTDPIPTLLMFSRMGSIGVWTAERIMLIYAIALTSFGLAESFCRGFDFFPWKMLQTGDFDRILLRPRSSAVLVMGSYFHIHRLARVATGIFIITLSLSRMGIDASAQNTVILLTAITGGTMMYAGVFILSSGIAFFTIKALDWIFILTNASYQVTRIPIDYMPRLLKSVFTFVMPMLVISYYPAAFICGWEDNPLAALLSLPAGFVFLLLSLLIWRIGVRHYKSTGS